MVEDRPDNPKTSRAAAGDNRAVFRFAPSPNGLLHLGHAYSALVNLRMARACGAAMLLRIEDIDTVRCTPANEKRMLEDLEWIGFEWDGEPLRQSARFEAYREVLDDLFDEGLVYPAMLSRRQIAEEVEAITAKGATWRSDPDGAPIYPGSERSLSMRERAALVEQGSDFALRLDMGEALSRLTAPLFWNETGAGPDGETGTVPADPGRWGDVVLGRKEIPASYHLSCVLDDAAQGITQIVRGRDLFHATSVHRLLQEILHLPVPTYHHHDLILDGTGRKLSKSKGDTALRHLREAGMTPADIHRMIGLDR